MAEWRMAKVVPQRDRLRQFFMQLQYLGDRPRDLGDLERVREPGAVMVAGRSEKDLGLVFEGAERLAVDDAVPVVLKRRTDVIFRLWMQPTA